MEKKVIYLKLIALYQLSQYKIAKYINYIIIECIQAIFIKINISRNLWPLIFNANLYIKNLHFKYNNFLLHHFSHTLDK